jgi:hypothetical protein
MPMTPQKRKALRFTVPATIAREVAFVARAEKKTRGALFKEIWRAYKRYRKQEEEQNPYTEEWVMNLIREAEEEERLHPMTAEEIEREEEELRRYGAAQAKKLGIKSDRDVERLIHEHRALLRLWETS